MSPTNVQHAINIVARAQHLDMCNWQHGRTWNGLTPCVIDESELKTCGTAACVGGHIAVSPEWKEAGGFASRSTGAPFRYAHIKGEERCQRGVQAIAHWLHLSEDLVNNLLLGHNPKEVGLYVSTIFCLNAENYSEFYGKLFGDVTKEDVLIKLKLIQVGELK